MAWDGAVVRVLAGLDRGANLRRAALRHRLALLVVAGLDLSALLRRAALRRRVALLIEAASALERDVVRDLRRVLHHERHLTGLRRQRRLVERELAARVRVQPERLADLPRGRGLCRLAGLVLTAVLAGAGRLRAALLGLAAALLGGLVLGVLDLEALLLLLAPRGDRGADRADHEDRRDPHHDLLE